MIDIQPNSRGNKFRAARVQLLKSLIDLTLNEKGTCAILDVGGTYNFWHVWRSEFDWERTQVTCINLDPGHLEEGKEVSRVRMLCGNACDLAGIRDKEFDIAFSNSVIEHVGMWRNMQQMAAEVKRVASRYMVQTPNFWFPVEPHARTPFLHWLPEPVSYRIVMKRKCGFWRKHETVTGAVETVQSAKLIDARQMKELFGDAQIVKEKFFGLTKSLIAIRE
jgi:ubiquinone/menaquinone biosynthesis C-methylase UbiE